MITKAEIKQLRSLAEKSTRTAEGLFVAEGNKLVGEIADSPLHIEQLWEVGRNLSAAEMARISQLKTPSDCLAVVRIPRYPASPPDQGLLLALDGVQDPGNVGTIIRLADWFGVSDIFLSPDSADCWGPKVVQATMGALTRVRLHPDADLPSLLAATRLPVFGTFLEGDPIYNHPLATNGWIVLGNEGHGISPAVASLVAQKLFIPPYPADSPTSESLNVATAAAIVLSEFRRRTPR